MGSKLALVVGLIAGWCTTTEAFAQAEPTGSWSAESGGEQFYLGASATDGTYLYIFGGYQTGSVNTVPFYMARLRRYDPSANSWSELPQMAAGTATGDAVWGHIYNAGAYYDGRLYSFGGYAYTGAVGSTTYTTTAPSNFIRCYTFSTGTWTTITPSSSPMSRYLHAAATHGDRIYITGGATNNVCEEFNPANNSISTMTAMPGILYYHRMASYPPTGKVFLMGGYGAAGYTGINYEYTPQDNDSSTNDTGGTWATRANISNGSAQQNVYYGHGVVTVNNRVYVIAGINQSNNQQNNVFEYNPPTNTWAQRASSAYGHYGYPGVGVINGRIYCYGGYPQYSLNEEYTPPNFGAPPNAPTGVAQTGSRAESSLQSLADTAQFDGWTNSQITFSATVTDPNATQQVRFRVQVKPESASWTTASAIVNLSTNLSAQGAHTIPYPIPAGGGFDWRWRIEDSYSNSYPDALVNLPAGWVEAFGTGESPNVASPDFRSDQLAPADPVALTPSDVDIHVPDPNVGDVVLHWIESTDNGPVAGISYELQVGDAGFIEIEAQLFSSAGTDTYPITLGVSRYQKYWRIRARDVGGNFSNWSPPLTFRVTYDDRLNHSAGDAKKSCGFGAVAAAHPVHITLFGLSILALALRRRGPPNRTA